MIHVDFVTLMKKSDFGDLYKYGRLYIDASISVPYDGEIDDLPEREDVCKKVFRRVNQFENTQVLLLVYYEKKNDNWDLLRIEEVKRVYALDEEAQRGCTSSFGDKIRFHAPIWPDYILDVQIKNAVEVCKQGSRNLWAIWELQSSIEKYESELTEAVRESIREVYENERPKGRQLPFWTYLLRYERHGYYPQGSPGYFLDAVNVLMNFAQGEETELGEDTTLYSRMQECDSKTKYSTLENKFDTKEKLKSKVGTCFDKYLEMSFLYFWLKSEVEKNGFKTEDALGVKNKKNEEFCYAAYLLGAVLGVDGTHEELYMESPLEISMCRRDSQNCRRDKNVDVNGNKQNKQAKTKTKPKVRNSGDKDEGNKKLSSFSIKEETQKLQNDEMNKRCVENENGIKSRLSDNALVLSCDEQVESSDKHELNEAPAVVEEQGTAERNESLEGDEESGNNLETCDDAEYSGNVVKQEREGEGVQGELNFGDNN